MFISTIFASEAPTKPDVVTADDIISKQNKCEKEENKHDERNSVAEENPDAFLTSADCNITPAPSPPPPPPPPPPCKGNIFGENASATNALPHGMKPKQKYTPPNAMKHLHWTSINPKDMDKRAIWITMDSEKMADEAVLEGFAKDFGSSSPRKRRKLGLIQMRRGKVLDGKSAQNISIFLRSLRVPVPELVRQVIEADEATLSLEVVQNVLKFVPDEDTMNKLLGFRTELDALTPPEQLMASLAGIPRVVPRLQLLEFKLRFPDLSKEVQENIATVTNALQEIKQRSRLHQLLELILNMGNYMNSGTYKAQSHGFHLSYLPKLADTVTVETRRTFLHCLCETAEQAFPTLNLTSFQDDLPTLQSACRVSQDALTQTLNHISGMIRQCNKELTLAVEKDGQEPNGNFVVAMREFALMAKQQSRQLTDHFQQMTQAYTDVCELFTFQGREYTLDQFLNDLNTFVKQFQSAKEDVMRQRELLKRKEKLKESAERAARERQKRKEAEKAKKDKDHCESKTIEHFIETFKMRCKRSRSKVHPRSQTVS